MKSGTDMPTIGKAFVRSARSFAFAALCFITVVHPAAAMGSAFPCARAMNGMPNLTGHLAFQGGADDESSYLFVYEFGGSVNRLGRHWHIIKPLNPNYSPTGQWITFTARPRSDKTKRIYVTDSAGSSLINLSLPSDGPDEDPRFSFDGNYIVFKENGSIAVMALIYGNGTITRGAVTQLIAGELGTSTEASGPVLTAERNRAYFFINVTPYEHIQYIGVDPNTMMPIGDATDVNEPLHTESYYPALSAVDDFFFVNHHVSDRRGPGKDKIYFAPYDSDPNEATASRSNVCDMNNSDPAPVDSSYYFFSITPDRMTPYAIVLGDHLGHVWKFPRNNPMNHVKIYHEKLSLLGSSYTPY